MLMHSGDVFVATVTGATCNCLPTEGEKSIIYCHDYQLGSASNEITVELVDRGQCNNGSEPYAVSIESVHTCSLLMETSGLINQGIQISLSS